MCTQNCLLVGAGFQIPKKARAVWIFRSRRLTKSAARLSWRTILMLIDWRWLKRIPGETEIFFCMTVTLAFKLLNGMDCFRSGVWRVFNGNELGALLGWWCFHCHQSKSSGEPLQDCYVLSSTVSSKILKTLAKAENFNFIETLTGFKWMGKHYFTTLLYRRSLGRQEYGRTSKCRKGALGGVEDKFLRTVAYRACAGW